VKGLWDWAVKVVFETNPRKSTEKPTNK